MENIVLFKGVKYSRVQTAIDRQVAQDLPLFAHFSVSFRKRIL
jgi:hypothetical protein